MQAAEAAMQEAAARDMAQRQANENSGGGGDSEMSRIAQAAAEQHMMDLEASNASLTMDTGGDDSQAEQQLNLLRALQAAEMGEHGGIPPHVLQEMSMLGMDPNDPESIQAILHMMAQQEQENARPDEHYLTIAQNGKFQQLAEAGSSKENLTFGKPDDFGLFPSRHDIRGNEDSHWISAGCSVDDISVSTRSALL